MNLHPNHDQILDQLKSYSGSNTVMIRPGQLCTNAKRFAKNYLITLTITKSQRIYNLHIDRAIKLLKNGGK